MLTGLSAFTIRGNITLDSKPSKTKARSSERGELEAGPSVYVNFEMVEMMYTGHVPPEIIHPEQNVKETREQILKKAELAKWKMVEIFKVDTKS